MRLRPLLALLAVLAISRTVALAFAPEIQFLHPPVGEESGMPFFATGPRGEVHLTWIDVPSPVAAAGGGEKEHALRMARWTGSGGGWSSAETIARGHNWFVNWIDFPSLAILPDGAMLAHWLERSEGSGRFGYGIRIARREAAAGSAWRVVQGLHLDEKVDYAGFLSFLPQGAGGAAVYLAPPKTPEARQHGPGDEHEQGKTVRFLALDARGGVAAEREIDADACSCCQTAMARVSGGGFLAAYRDHEAGEIRDIAVVRFDGKSWSAPRALHRDGWKINGCPTEGPSMATTQDGKQVAITWLTRAGGVAKVQLAWSGDAGRTFGGVPVRVDGGNPVGRPAVMALEGSEGYLVTWLEKSGTEGRSEIRLRRVDARGKPGAKTITVAGVSAGRVTGFPKIAFDGVSGRVMVAWRDGRVRVATVALQEFERTEQR